MTLTVTDDPPDRPEWVSETIRLLADGTDKGRARLLARVEQVSDAELAASLSSPFVSRRDKGAG